LGDGCNQVSLGGEEFQKIFGLFIPNKKNLPASGA
jgi:hypothetical protein